MVKVGNENVSHALNILYANNHFEPAITCDYKMKISNIHTCVTYDIKFHIDNINDENNEVQHRRKIFNWNFELNKNLQEIIRIRLEWLP
jgi:outer membrane receptor protein involved in Fe transport